MLSVCTSWRDPKGFTFYGGKLKVFMVRVYETAFGIVCFGRNIFFVHRQLAFGILGYEIAAYPRFYLLKVSISLYIYPVYMLRFHVFSICSSQCWSASQYNLFFSVESLKAWFIPKLKFCQHLLSFMLSQTSICFWFLGMQKEIFWKMFKPLFSVSELTNTI